MWGSLPKQSSSCLNGLRCWGALFCTKDDRDPRLPEGAWRAATANVTEAAKQEVEALLQDNSLFRDGHADARSPVTVCEKELARYLGLKYCIAVNSYGSALFLSLKAAGVGSGDRVLGNAMGSVDVPSAIHRAEAEFVPVGNTRELAVDVRELAWRADQTGARFLLLSHVRGHVSELNDIAKVCSERGITLIEDCAHSLGVWWDGRHTGHHGLVACISAQAGTLLDVGDGGFVVTDDVVIAAVIAAMAGSYTRNFRKAFAAPECQVFKDIDQGRFPNYSLAMPNISATILRFGMEALDRRVSEVNRKHGVASARFLSKMAGDLSTSVHLHVPRIHPKARPCLSSLHFWADLSPEASAYFLSAACERGVPVKLCFTAGETPKFAQGNLAAYTLDEIYRKGESPAYLQTTALPGQVYGVCIPPQLSDEHCECVADVLVTALAEAFAENPVKVPAPGSPYRPDGLAGARQGPTGPGSPHGSLVSPAGAGSAKFTSRPEGPAAVTAARMEQDRPPASAGVCYALDASPNLRQTTSSLPPYTYQASARPASESGSVSSRSHSKGCYEAAALPGAAMHSCPWARVITAEASGTSPLSVSSGLHEPRIPQSLGIGQPSHPGRLDNVLVEGPCLHKKENAEALPKTGNSSTTDTAVPMRSEDRQAGPGTGPASMPQALPAPPASYGSLDRSRVVTPRPGSKGSATIPGKHRAPASQAPLQERNDSAPLTEGAASRESTSPLDLMSPFGGMEMPSTADSSALLWSHAPSNPRHVLAHEARTTSQSSRDAEGFHPSALDRPASCIGSSLPEGQPYSGHAAGPDPRPGLAQPALRPHPADTIVEEAKPLGAGPPKWGRHAADLDPCPGLAQPAWRPHSGDAIVKDIPERSARTPGAGLAQSALRPHSGDTIVKDIPECPAKTPGAGPPKRAIAPMGDPRAKWSPLAANGAARKAFGEAFTASRPGRHRGSCFSKGRAVNPSEGSDDSWSLGSGASSKGASTEREPTSWWPWG